MGRERWFHADGTRRVGPISRQQLVTTLITLAEPRQCRVWHRSLSDWTIAGRVPRIAHGLDELLETPGKGCRNEGAQGGAATCRGQALMGGAEGRHPGRRRGRRRGVRPLVSARAVADGHTDTRRCASDRHGDCTAGQRKSLSPARPLRRSGRAGRDSQAGTRSRSFCRDPSFPSCGVSAVGGTRR